MVGPVGVVSPQLMWDMADVLQAQKAPSSQEEAEQGGGVEALAAALVAMAAYADELRLAAHLGHFNVEGSNFLSLHKFLEDQYKAHTAEFDTLLELVRSMDFFAPKCRPCLQGALGREFIHPQSVDTREILVCYYRNLEAYGMAAKELGRLAKDTNAPDVENYAAELVGSAFKGSWFAKSLLRGG